MPGGPFDDLIPAAPAPATGAGPTIGNFAPGAYRDPRDSRVVRAPDGTVIGIGEFSAPPSAAVPGQPVEISIDGTTDPDSIRDYMSRRPELATAVGPAPGNAPEPGQGAGSSIVASPGAADGGGGGPPAPQDFSKAFDDLVPKGPPPNTMGGGDPGRPRNAVERVLRDADTGVRSIANFATGGFADKAAAGLDAIPALLKGGGDAWVKQYSSNLDAQQLRDKADWRDAPGAVVAGAIPGVLAQGALLPEMGMASASGRFGVGAAQAFGLGAFDSLGHSRGNVIKALPQAAVDGGVSALIGGPLGAAIGARAAPAALDAVSASAPALADHAITGVDPMLASNGPRAVRQISQTLMGTPFVGTPLAKAAARQQAQAGSFLKTMASRYGSATTPEDAGVPVAGAALAAVRKAAAAKDDAAQNVLDIAARYGATPQRRVIGETVKAGVDRFAGSGSDMPILNAGSYPARATSFGAKAEDLYSRAFDRLDREMPGGTRGTFEPLPGSPGAEHTAVDDTLNAIRSGKMPKVPSRPSLLDYVSRNGGLRDEGGELSAMDAEKWHRAQPFRRKLVSEGGRSLEDMAQKAHEAGYFPDAKAATMKGSENMHPVSGQDLLDAMRGELAGAKRYAGPPPKATIQDEGVSSTQELLDHLGLDPKKATNTQIKAAFARFADGRAGATGHILPSATQAVVRDIAERAQSPAVKGLLDAPEVRKIADAVGKPETLSFNDLRSMRTWVRQAQKNDRLRQTIGDADLQRLESSLTSDIYNNADRLASPRAAQELRRADKFYAAGNERINRALSGFARTPSGEGAFDRIIGAASNGGGADIAKLRGLQRSLHPNEWREVASGAIARMGEGPDGFDLGKFVSNYDKLSKDGAETLFGGRNAALKPALDRVVAGARRANEADPAKFFGDSSASAFEGVLRAARTRGGSADTWALRDLKHAIPDQWGEVSAGVLNTLGNDGHGGLSMAKFVSEWDKLSPEGKAVLFGGPGRDGDLAAMSSLVRIMRHQGVNSKFYNHSNSGHAGAGLLGLIEGGRALMEGNHHEIALMAGLAAMGRGGAHALASPKFARLALRMAKAPSPDAFEAADAAMARVAQGSPKAAVPISDFRISLRRARANAPALTAGALGQPVREDVQRRLAQ